jgi:hypothetical protein
VLAVFFGKRYMITQNSNLARGVGNGMWAIVVDVQLREDVEPRWDASAGAHRVDADQVACMVIRYTDRDWGTQQLHSDLPPGHFVLVPDTPQNAPSGYKVFTYGLGGNEKKFRITQLPLIQARAISGHKSQGQTLAKIVVSHLHRRASTGTIYCLLRALGWFYTAVSRTKARTGLTLETQLPLQHMQQTRLDVLAELARLRVLHEETHARLHGTVATAAGDNARLQAAREAHTTARRAHRRHVRQQRRHRRSQNTRTQQRDGRGRGGRGGRGGGRGGRGERRGRGGGGAGRGGR